MSVSDEEPYSTIFASLKHPIRRRILRMLSKKPMSFSEMLEVLGVSSSFLTYHLENLGELVSKMEDGKYKLSSFGEAAIATMTKVEDIPTTALQQSQETKPRRVAGRSAAIASGIICILLIAGLGGAIAYYTMTINNKDNEMNSQKVTINQLNATIANLEKIANLQESTVIVQDYGVANAPNSSTIVISNNTVVSSNAFFNGSQPLVNHIDIDHAGYIAVSARSLGTVVELKYSSNGLDYDNTVNSARDTFNVNMPAILDAYFPVLPTNTLTILVGNLENFTPFGNVTFPNPISSASPSLMILETVTITYYY